MEQDPNNVVTKLIGIKRENVISKLVNFGFRLIIVTPQPHNDVRTSNTMLSKLNIRIQIRMHYIYTKQCERVSNINQTEKHSKQIKRMNSSGSPEKNYTSKESKE